MSRINDLFERKKENVLNVYFTAGYPTLDSTLDIMMALQDAGVDLIELGMQLMCSHSEENDTPCLDIFQEKVKRFVADQPHLKIPQIGWNTIHGLKTPLFRDVEENSHCYFVHSYYATLGKHTIAQTDYCGGFSAALQTRNYYGVQFHPEKSAEVGSTIIKNFLNII